MFRTKHINRDLLDEVQGMTHFWGSMVEKMLEDVRTHSVYLVEEDSHD